MITSSNFNKFIDSIDSHAFGQYLINKGWKKRDLKRTDIDIFQYTNKGFEQVTIPLDKELNDYSEAMSKAVNTISNWENITQKQLLTFLLNSKADIIKI